MEITKEQIKEGINTFDLYLDGKTYIHMNPQIPTWDELHWIYSKVLKDSVDNQDDNLDSYMKIVGDNLLDSDREGFFLSLVEVINHLNSNK